MVDALKDVTVLAKGGLFTNEDALMKIQLLGVKS